ncbi:ncair mutase-like protein [Halogeometricum borinquense DSM 11551]|uniref:NCAIR mutase-like protein n=1 Tax=Halogeometricum borinquense (strain ATCC 700274 / DSM 11551 / JCM 10706 / KCTC 4070 / PR3) TaxID=469382 RepID=E4NRI5_HALBP|nr:nickel pincer cofactor biosynthesis protein LarB [Halogeometricum borinquense]ADQ65661.1 NCAIR mutase-like protein [Halogeometricum borinquense DSM 11551]ELY26992.1 ncair mutase-like protein [Halogeometricum borinquense DSM 11551]
MRDILEAVASGDLDPAVAEARLSGYATTGAGRFDAARETRRGVPEAILADGKTPDEAATLAAAAVKSTGRAILTRADDTHVDAVVDTLNEEVTFHRDDRARTLVAHAPDFDPPTRDATVGIVTGGTSDAEAAGEASVILEEMGATVTRVEDVGVAHLGRVIDHLDTLRAADVLVVAAGREGALPTVVAGLVDTPVIGLPVSTGYGHGGSGKAALEGMLQSCTVISVVNIDAGFVAGAQAGLIARAISDARTGNDQAD